MEEIVFPVPNICEFLTSESKLRVYYTTERDEQGSKINDFFLRAEDLFNEMNWQKKLRGEGGVAGSDWQKTLFLWDRRRTGGVKQLPRSTTGSINCIDARLKNAHILSSPREAIDKSPLKNSKVQQGVVQRTHFKQVLTDLHLSGRLTQLFCRLWVEASGCMLCSR